MNIGHGTRIVLLGFVTLFVGGCVGATEIRHFETRVPLSPTGEGRPIMFKKMISKLSRGQEVGTVEGGLACVGQGKLFWKRGGQVQVGDDELADTLRDELTRAGYKVVGDPNALFEDPQEWQAAFLIAGIIKHVAVNVCYPWAGFMNFVTSKGEASIEVEWQIFERQTRSVVLTASTGGTARTDSGAHQGMQAYYNAFGVAVRNLLAEGRFASLMSQPTAPPIASPERSPRVPAQERTTTGAIIQLQPQYDAFRLFSQPNTSAERLGSVSAGVPLKVLEERQQWLYVETPDEHRGWILREWMQQ